jgi:hypothetical protein
LKKDGKNKKRFGKIKKDLENKKNWKKRRLENN